MSQNPTDSVKKGDCETLNKDARIGIILNFVLHANALAASHPNPTF
jgi:hypothetical protein